MTRKILLSAGIALLLIPALAAAQENQPQPGLYCPHLTQDLKKGDRDLNTNGQVTELQKFLVDYYDLNPDDYVTGYFGFRTQQNVIRFQTEQNLPAYGYVGPLTRAAIARVCAETATPPPPTVSTLSPSQGPVGTTITISGSGFTDDNTVIFGSGLVPPDGSMYPARISSTNGGTTITFAVPHDLEPGCYPICGGIPPHPVTPGTYDVYVKNANGQSHSSVTFTVTAGNTGNASCTWNNQTIADGQSVTAYQSSSVPQGQQCASQQRTCHSGTLDGSYQYATCAVLIGPPLQSPPTVSLLINNQANVTITPGSTFTLTWSSTNADSCNLTNAQNQTNSTPPNITGSSQGAAPSAGQTFTYTLSCTNSGGTTTKSASVTGQATVPPPVASSCTYKGQSYAEGQSVVIPAFFAVMNTFTALCDNGAWVFSAGGAQPPAGGIGMNVCDVTWLYPPTSLRADFGCTPNWVSKAFLTVTSRHGKAPLTVSVQTIGFAISPGGFMCAANSLSWGDGTTGDFPVHTCDASSEAIETRTHTYSASGSYVISYTNPPEGGSNSANIRVDSANTASLRPGSGQAIQNQSQLASVLTALQSALQAILQLLGQ